MAEETNNLSIPPKESDWGDLRSDLDVASAFDRFGGLTIDEAHNLLKNDIDKDFLDDFLFLPEVIFDYYFPALIELALYIEKNDSTRYQNFVNAMFSLVDGVISADEERLIFWWPKLGPALKRLSESQVDYGLDLDIYQDFSLAWNALDEAVNRRRGTLKVQNDPDAL